MKKKILSLLAALLMTTVAAMPAFAANKANPSGCLWLSDCDSLDGWKANSNGDPALIAAPDTDNKTEGSGSIGAKASNGKLNYLTFTPGSAIDASGYQYLEFDMYFDNMGWANDCASVMIEITSSGREDRESNRWPKSVVMSTLENQAIDGKTNWYHFKLEIAKPKDSAYGGCSLNRVNFFRFYTVDNISTTPDYEMRIDNVMFTNNGGGGTGTTSSTTPVSSAKPVSSASSAGQASSEEASSQLSSLEPSSEIPVSAALSSDAAKASGSNIAVPVIITAAVVLVLCGGGFAAFWFLVYKKKDNTKTDEDEKDDNSDK